MNKARFTLDGDDLLEVHLDQACRSISRQLLEAVPGNMLEALLLGGGYGRGEGGVLRRNSQLGDAPYNDLEFFVFIKGPVCMRKRHFLPAIHRLEQRMTAELGIDVEFKLLSKRQFDAQPTTMFYYDLVQGHRVVHGPPDFLAGHPHGDASRIPLSEATRLLLNRLSGLLFSREKLGLPEFDGGDADFVYRNLAKARLALGDALLVTRGSYHWSCIERGERLGRLNGQPLPEANVVRALHQEGIAFKLHPHQPAMGREALSRSLDGLLPVAWSMLQHVEGVRLGLDFENPRGYAMTPTSLCPEEPAARNALVRLRQFGPKGIAYRTFRYPREALLRSLVLLLWEPGGFGRDQRFLGRELGQPVASWRDAVIAYGKLWHRYN